MTHTRIVSVKANWRAESLDGRLYKPPSSFPLAPLIGYIRAAAAT
jgi:hypothetical protein